MSQLKFDFEKLPEPELPFEEFKDKSIKQSKEISMRECAFHCAVSYRFFVIKLIKKNILGKSSQGRNLPFQSYINRRWFVVRNTMLIKDGFRGMVPKVTVTPLGYSEIKKIINEK